MMQEKTLKELAGELTLEIKDKFEDIRELNSNDPNKIFKIVRLTVRYVENMVKNKELEKEDKKEYAIEVIVQLLDSHMTDYMTRFISGLLIDQAVETLNGTLGKAWIERV